MIARVLGSSAGGGVPQWNCACAHCAAARAGRAPRRTESTLAISADGRAWILLNASHDVASQIESFAPLQPSHGRVTPIGDILLTDANLDHIGGLSVLRQSTAPMRVWSTAAVRAIASSQPGLAHFLTPPHRWCDVPLDATLAIPSGNDLAEPLTVRAIAVGATTPGYDGRHDAEGAVVAYEIGDRRSSARLLFAPVFGEINKALADAIASAAVAVLDGTCYTDDELETSGLGQKRARAMGHQPVGGAGGTLERIRGARGRVIFTHLNNSNPMLDPNSEAYAAVRAAGAEIAYDGMELTL